jgi:hypothetical protein
MFGRLSASYMGLICTPNGSIRWPGPARGDDGGVAGGGDDRHALARARGLVTKHAVKQVDRLLRNNSIDVWDSFVR